MKYIKLLLVLSLAALNFNLIIKPLNLVCGGNQGLALVIRKFINLDVSIIILIINLISLLICYIYLKNEITINTIYSSLIYPLLIKITSINIYINKKYILIYIIISAIIYGITTGLIYKLKSSAGGINTIVLIISKRLKIKVGYIALIINILIIILGIIIFPINNSIYSFLIILIGSFVTDIVLMKKTKELKM